jgi:hypothetical protein
VSVLFVYSSRDRKGAVGTWIFARLSNPRQPARVNRTSTL